MAGVPPPDRVNLNQPLPQPGHGCGSSRTGTTTSTATPASATYDPPTSTTATQATIIEHRKAVLDVAAATHPERITTAAADSYAVSVHTQHPAAPAEADRSGGGVLGRPRRWMPRGSSLDSVEMGSAVLPS